MAPVGCEMAQIVARCRHALTVELDATDQCLRSPRMLHSDGPRIGAVPGAARGHVASGIDEHALRTVPGQPVHDPVHDESLGDPVE